MRLQQEDLWALTFVAVITVVSVSVQVSQAVPLTDPVVWQLLLEGDETWSHLAFIAAQTGQVVIPFIPGQATGLASGYLFGTALGTLYTMIGTVIGSVIAFVVSRVWGRRVLEALFEEDTINHWNEVVDSYGVPVFFTLILLPGFPDDVLCFMAGLSSMRFDAYLVSIILGRIPLSALYAYAGANPGGLFTAEGVGLALGFALVSWACFSYRGVVIDGVDRLT